MQVLAGPRLLVSADASGCVMVSHMPWPESSQPATRWPAFSITLDADLQVLHALLCRSPQPAAGAGPEGQPGMQAQRERLRELESVEAATKRVSEGEKLKHGRRIALQLQQVP